MEQLVSHKELRKCQHMEVSVHDGNWRNKLFQTNLLASRIPKEDEHEKNDHMPNFKHVVCQNKGSVHSTYKGNLTPGPWTKFSLYTFRLCIVTILCLVPIQS